MNPRSRRNLVRVAASPLLLVAILGVRHCGDMSLPDAAAAMTSLRDTANWERALTGIVGQRTVRTAAAPRPTTATCPLRLVGNIGNKAGNPVDAEQGAALVELLAHVRDGLDTSLEHTVMLHPGAAVEGIWVDQLTIDPQQLHAWKARTYRSIRNMSALAGPELATPECPKRAYDLVDLDRAVDAAATDLVSLIPVQAEPLRAFVRSSYPRPSGVEVPYECFSRRGLISPLAADGFLNEVEHFYERIPQDSAITLDLAVKSNPPGASYILRSIHTDIGEVDNTTNSIARLFRGVYNFQITRSGFKPARLEHINLVNSTPRLMECQLRSIKDADDSTCRLQ